MLFEPFEVPTLHLSFMANKQASKQDATVSKTKHLEPIRHVSQICKTLLDYGSQVMV